MPNNTAAEQEPLLIVESENKETANIKRRVVLAVDNSPQSQHTFLWALQSYLNSDDHLTLVHSYEPPYGPYSTQIWNPYGVGEIYPYAKNVNELAEKQHANCLRMYGRICQKHGFKNFKMILVRGTPREELVRYTERHPTDCLIIGSHGYGAVKRAFLGSVSNHCVHHCKCPVLVVRGQELGEVFQKEYDDLVKEVQEKNDALAKEAQSNMDA